MFFRLLKGTKTVCQFNVMELDWRAAGSIVDDMYNWTIDNKLKERFAHLDIFIDNIGINVEPFNLADDQYPLLNGIFKNFFIARGYDIN